MINWAIGDPRPKEGVVIQAEDIWAGTSGRVIVTSDTLPQVQLDKAPLDLSRTGPTTYEPLLTLILLRPRISMTFQDTALR